MEKYFDPTELPQLKALYRELLDITRPVALDEDCARLRSVISRAILEGQYGRDRFGHNLLIHNLTSALNLCQRISPDRNMVIAILLTTLCRNGFMTEEEVAKEWDEDIAKIIKGLDKVSVLYNRSAAIDTENFRKLLLTFAEDIRVIIIMIVDRYTLMKEINHHPDEQMVVEVAKEASNLYAPLAHRLGLYSIKGELEDLSLKYTNREMYTRIARKLNETKRSRDAYITAFITPVKEALEKEGLKFEIKGRTKSIYSIWNKMKKQRVDIEGIYDLFAIRVIIDTPLERERSECWLAYSIVTNMYQPNPARLKDWLSIPKSNGYESLHITVKGPDSKWVEVQIRTRRMDEIAERGVAAHWKYKGIKSEQNLDTWMNRVREILEAAEDDPLNLMKNLKMDIYDKEVFVFTPKGDLYRLPLGGDGARLCVYDSFAPGMCMCTGARVNGRTRKLNHKLESGDTVEIMTSANQVPKQDWLGMVVTSKARTKIKQTLNEQAKREADLGREILERKFKNRKIDSDEGIVSKVAKKLGYKTMTDFFNDIAAERLEVSRVMAEYDTIAHPTESTENRSADEFVLQPQSETEDNAKDVLVIGDNIKGVNYKLSKCCNPIYGDDVFGFVSADGAIKIHRLDCPNASNMQRRFPYRLIPVRWSGRIGQQFATSIRIVGVDDIGIVTNISSIINKEKDCTLRSISIDSHDGIFQGSLVVGVVTTDLLETIIKKIRTVKGVKTVSRN